MPPGRPVSPLSLETYSLSPSDNEDLDGLVASDDDLDDVSRAAQKQRIEKLAEAYSQGKPLFILSASLRGPFDKGWVNPWKKDRRKKDTPVQKARKPSKQEANSSRVEKSNPRKRRQNDDTDNAKRSARSGSRSASINPSNNNPTADPRSSIKPVRDGRNRDSISPETAKRPLPYMPATHRSSQSYHPTPSANTDESWLKKDGKQMRFQNIEPPTSPTTSISSRHREGNHRPSKVPRVKHRIDAVTSNQAKPVPKAYRRPSATSWHNPQGSGFALDTQASQTFPSPDTSPHLPRSSMQQGSASQGPSDMVNPDGSLHVLASQSHLPKFEYRRRNHIPSDSFSPIPTPVGPRDNENNVTEVKTDPPHGEIAPTDVQQDFQGSSGHCSEPEDEQDSCTVQNASNTIEDVSKSDIGNRQTDTNPITAESSVKPPSAQQVSGNPVMTGCVTSLYSIAVPKSDGDGDAVPMPAPQFSTQTALELAQKSFQDDLESPEHVLAASQHFSRPSPGQAPSSVSNLVTSQRLNTPKDENHTARSKAPDTAGGHFFSTQYIINAATPFAFSTEKGVKTVDYGMNISGKNVLASRLEKLKTANLNFSTPSPSETGLEAPKSGIDRVPDSMPRPSPDIHGHHTETQPSPLPMTLTGTTPPTAQDGQGGFRGAASFNLTQAIAEAGSWLQQSFDFTKDLQEYKESKPGPSSSKDTQQSTFGMDLTS